MKRSGDPAPKSKETENLEKDREKIVEGITASKESSAQQKKSLIAFGVSMGKTKEELLSMGLTQEDLKDVNFDDKKSKDSVPTKKDSEAKDRTPSLKSTPEVTEPKESERKIIEAEDIEKKKEEILDTIKAGEEIKNLEDEEKEKTNWGLGNVGFKVEQMKNKLWASAFGAVAEKMNRGGTAGKVFEELKNSFIRDAQEAEKKAAGEDGFKKGAFSTLKLVGNITKYGRMIADVTGASIANPFRYVMMGGMVTSRLAEAGKEVRLNSEDVLSQTRVEDIDKAWEEAHAIYEKARIEENKIGNKNISGEALKKAYIMEMPKDIQRRLEDTSVASGFIQKTLKSDIQKGISNLNKKIEKIESDENLSPEQKEQETEKLILKQKKKLEEYDRMVTQYGTVDEIAMSLRYAQKLGKGVVLGMQIETAVVSLDKLWGSLSHLLSNYGSTTQVDSTFEKLTEKDWRIKTTMGPGDLYKDYEPTLAEPVANPEISNSTLDNLKSEDWRIKTTMGPGDLYKDYVPGEVGGGTNTAGVEIGKDWRIKTNIGPGDIYKDYVPQETVSGTSAPEVEADKFDDTKFNENHSKIPNDNLKELPGKPKITIEPKLEDKYALPPQVNPEGDIVSEQTLPPQVNPGETLTTPIATNPDATTLNTAEVPKTDPAQIIKLTESNSNGMTNGPIDNTGYSQGAISPLKGEYNTYGTEESQEVYNDENSWTTKVPMTDRAVFEQRIKIPTSNLGSNIENTDLKNIHTESMGELETAKVLDGLRDKGDVLDTFGRDNIIDIEKPDTANIQNISHENWNNYSDNLFKTKGIKFEDYAEYEKETQLQKLFGTGEEGIVQDPITNESSQAARMTYFRDQPIWPTVEKIPAKYLFNFDEAMLGDPTKISQAQFQALMSAGILDENHEFFNKQALSKLAEVYTKYTEYDTTNSNPNINQDTFKKLVEMNSKPFDNETIEKYVERITEKVHQTNDGTLFVIKPEAFSGNKIHILNKENVYMKGAGYDDKYNTRTINIPRGNIAPGRELYKTGGVGNIYPNYGGYRTGYEGGRGRTLGNAVGILIRGMIEQNNRYGDGNLNSWTHKPRGY